MMSSQAQPNLAKYRTFSESHAASWRRLLQKLVQTPSCFEQEHAITELVASHIEALGIEVQRVPHTPELLARLPGAQRPISQVPGRCSLVARVPGCGSGQSLVLNTHLDIVPAGDPSAWTHPPFSGWIDDTSGVIYGRGAMDDKAGVAVALAVMEMVVGIPVRLAGDLLFHFVLEDEITANGTLLCLEAGHHADAAVIIDGTRKEKAIDQHAGNLQFEIQVRGRPASVSVSHMGVNAAETLARLALHLRDAVFALNAGRSEPWTRFPSPYQLVVQKFHSEGAQLTVPELATAQCYATFPPPLTLSTMRQFLQTQLDDFLHIHQQAGRAELLWAGFAVEPVCSRCEPLKETLRQTAERCGAAPIEVGPSTGTSDMRHFAAAGIPALLYGPGSGFNPHRPDECYHLDDLSHMALFFLTLAETWCNAAGSGRARSAA